MKKPLLAFFLIALVLLAPELAAGRSFFGKTTVRTGNLDIAVQSFRNEIVAVGLENRSGKPVQCRVTFSNGAQFSETRRANIASGKRVTLGYPVHTITAKVDIDVQCAPGVSKAGLHG